MPFVIVTDALNEPEALLDAIATQLPDVEVSGAAAGLHAVLHIENAHAVAEAARAHGIALEAMGGKLIVGYANLPESQAKAAVEALVRGLAAEEGRFGVRANCVCPGWVRTPMGDRAMDWLAGELGISRDAAYLEATAGPPLRRPSEPEEIAAVVAWLLSAEASSVNGAVIPVDGGQSIFDLGALAFAKVPK